MDNNAQTFVKTLPTFTRYYYQELFNNNNNNIYIYIPFMIYKLQAYILYNIEIFTR